MPDLYDIRVSSALLGSGLTPAQCMVYIAIRSFQGANEYSLASQRMIAETLGYNKSTVNRSIAKLLESGWIEIHTNGRYIKCLDTPFGKAYEPSQSVRKKRTKQEESSVRKKRTECTHSATEVYAFCNRDLKTNNKTNNKTNIGRFDDFWEVYPKKRAKENCRKKWKAKKLDRIADEIIADVVARKEKDDRWLRGFILDPHTYLNGNRWEDEMEPPTLFNGKKNGVGPMTYNEMLKQFNLIGGVSKIQDHFTRTDQNMWIPKNAT